MSRRVALIIGVSEYGTGFEALPAAVKDARAIEIVLADSQWGDFEIQQRLENPEKQEMEEAIESLFKGLRPEDVALLYFSGHGIVDDYGNLYLAARTTRKDKGNFTSATALSAGRIHYYMEQSRVKQKIIILDCCHSGAFTEGLKAKGGGSINVKRQLGGKGCAVLVSSNAIQSSFESKTSEFSVYTQYLLEGIQTGAADWNGDGEISADDLHQYACVKVQDVTQRMMPEIHPVGEGYNIMLSKTNPPLPPLRYQQEIQRRAEQGVITFAQRTLLDDVIKLLKKPPRNDVVISPVHRESLNALRDRLGLPLEAASQIETEVLKPYRLGYEKWNRYEKNLLNAMRQENPLSEATLKALKDLQRNLGLSDAHAESSRAKIAQKLRRSSSTKSRQTYRPFLWLLIGGGGIIIALAVASGLQLGEQQSSQQIPAPPSTPVEPSMSPSPLPNPTVRSPSSEPESSPTGSPSTNETFEDIDNRFTRKQQARNFYDKCLEHYNSANQFNRRIYEEAKGYCDQGIKLNADDTQLYVLRGHIYFSLRELDLAIADYREANRLQPDDPIILESLGSALEKDRDLRGAIDKYNQAREIYDKQGNDAKRGNMVEKIKRLERNQ
jgi:tetratricopeptide (TPR) repeat protein